MPVLSEIGTLFLLFFIETFFQICISQCSFFGICDLIKCIQSISFNFYILIIESLQKYPFIHTADDNFYIQI